MALDAGARLPPYGSRAPARRPAHPVCSTTRQISMGGQYGKIQGQASLQIDALRAGASLARLSRILLDLGAGDGRFVRHMATRCPARFAIGVDACRENLRADSRTRAGERALPDRRCAQALPCALMACDPYHDQFPVGQSAGRVCWPAMRRCWAHGRRRAAGRAAGAAAERRRAGRGRLGAGGGWRAGAAGRCAWPGSRYGRRLHSGRASCAPARRPGPSGSPTGATRGRCIFGAVRG